MDVDDFVPTKGSSMKSKAQSEFKVVTYESHKSKKKESTVTPLEKAPPPKIDKRENEVNMKRMRYEIIKFGTSGFDERRKEEAKILQAIRLGAKPPKNPYKNYKELLTEKKKLKEEQLLQTNLLQAGKNKLGKSTAKGKSYDRKQKKAKSDILGIYGTVKKSALEKRR